VRAAVVAGARPQFVKAAALLPALARRGTARLVHAGQHGDPRMVEAHFAGLALPAPSHRIELAPGDRAARLSSMTEGLERHFRDARPDVVLALGDADAAVAAARAAHARSIAVAHVEAGARSFEADLPEERNRVEVDALARLLFCSTAAHARNLAGREGVHVTGDVTVDVLLAHEAEIRARAPAGHYAVLTVHRAATADDPARLASILEGVAGAGVPVVFPVHPRTARALPELPPCVVRRDPMPYLDFLGLVAGARVVVTDSGGLQKEAYLLGVPCVTLREATEWMETVEAGWNVLVGTDRARIAAALAAPPRGAARPEHYGDGRAAERIAKLLFAAFGA
jgi:UDP-GlcNAc3NAcA epimerase